MPLGLGERGEGRGGRVFVVIATPCRARAKIFDIQSSPEYFHALPVILIDYILSFFYCKPVNLSTFFFNPLDKKPRRL